MNARNGIEWKLTRARTQLILNQPFFGTLCLRLKLAPGPFPTMATDGQRIAYNPAFVDELKPIELEAVLAHEVLHCALGHHCGRGDRDPRLWNEVADFAINPILVANGFALAAGALVDPAFDNLCAEEIYARWLRAGRGGSDALSNQTSQQPGTAACSGQQGNQNDALSNSSAQQVSQEPATPTSNGEHEPQYRPGGFGEVLDATDDGNPAPQSEKNRQQHEWSIAAEQAIRSAKACGHEPANIDRPLSESRESKQDWRAILREFVAATAPSDYRWTPPNRRYVGSGLYLPSVERSGVGQIVIGVDTSWAIGSAELEQFAGEISAIADEATPEVVHVVYSHTIYH